MTWQVEEGIGEERALLYEQGHAVAARLRWPGGLEAGLVADAVLFERSQGQARGKVRFASGDEALVDRLPREASQGAQLRLQVTRAALREQGRVKLAQARPTTLQSRPAPSLAESLGGKVVRRFPDGAWDEIWTEAADGTVAFSGGLLHFAPTAAMTLVDVDGNLPGPALAVAAVAPLAEAIGRFGLAGSIGVDFPTLPDRADRKAVDVALGEALADWDHERTAMNGFGFVQLVARSHSPSLLHRVKFEYPAASARLLLRRAEGLEGAGALQLSARPRVLAELAPDWLDALGHRTGRTVRLAPDPTLAVGPGHAQIVPR